MKNQNQNQKKHFNRFEKQEGEWEFISPYKIDKIIDSKVGLEIFIQGTKDNVQSGVFTFQNYYGYRNFDEGDLWKRWSEIGVLSSGFYSAIESELIGWAEEQSVHEEIPRNIINYLFVSIDDVLDVLAFEPPIFKLLSTSKLESR